MEAGFDGVGLGWIDGFSDSGEAQTGGLSRSSAWDTIEIMSALELLKEVKALSAKERQEFLRKVVAIKQQAPARPGSRARRVNWPDVEARARRNSGGKLLPNLVLMQREDAAY